MELKKSLLEDWLRKNYFNAKYDLGSSGVQNFSIKELISLASLDIKNLEQIVLNDNDTFGHYELRNLIAKRFGDGDPDTVVIGNGSNEVIYFVLNTILSSDDEVIILDPIYYPLVNIPKALNCKIKFWKLEASNNFLPNLDTLKNLISSKTRMVIVNFPHNPTGVTLSLEELQSLIQIVSSVNAYLVWDAAFQDLVYENSPLPNPYLYYEKTIYINTLTKCYGLAGLRIGWCITSPETIKNFEIMKDYTSLYVSLINEYIGLIAINHLDILLKHRLQVAKSNLKLLKTWLNLNQDHIYFHPPQGGVSAFVRINKYDDTEVFCNKLMQDKGILLVPGKCFNYSQYVRLGFGSSHNDFEAGINLISEYFKLN